MTISKGSSWGRAVPTPSHLRVARGDAELAELLSDGSGEATTVLAGDMWRTVGAGPGERSRLNELPIDLLDVRLDDDALVAVSHVVARLPWWRGGWWRGPVIAAMNAEFVGGFDVAPRGHPNDGRMEVLRASAQMPIRQRVAVRSRLRSASHLPHPQIETRSLKEFEFTASGRLVVIVDGRRRRRVRSFSVRVRPDAAVLYA